MLCVYGKFHVSKPKQCTCSQGNKEEHYHESPKGTGHWNNIKWSDDFPKIPRVPHAWNESQCDYHKEDTKELPFTKAFGRDYLSVVGVHAEGEPYDIVTGGICLDDVDDGDIVEQQESLRDSDLYRSILLSEPLGRCGMNAAIILPPTCPCTDKGIVFMRSNSCKPTQDPYQPVSVSGLICATKVMLEYETNERYELGQKECSMTWDTVAGPVTATGIVSTNGRESWCSLVIVENIPSFVLELDYQVNCPGVGTITADIAFGGVFCAFVDSSSLGLKMEIGDMKKMTELGERIKDAINASYKCSHPELPFLEQISSVVFTESVSVEKRKKKLVMATVVSPGRLNRSPSGTATSARLAILHKRGEIGDEEVESRSLTGGSYSAAIVGHTKLDQYDAVVTRIGGRAWTTSMKQVGVERSDRFVEGFRLDVCRRAAGEVPVEDLGGLGIRFDGVALKRWHDRNGLLGETY